MASKVRESNAAEKIRCMAGAGALLHSKNLCYVDTPDVFAILSGLDGHDGELVVPKDGYTDSRRFADALREKLPAFGDFEVGILPIPLTGELGNLDPEEFAAFDEAWKSREAKYTDKRWGQCFQTYARDYMFGDDVIVLELGEREHYYNIVFTTAQKLVFEEFNPGLKYELCSEHCAPMKEFVHYHGVHGYYRGSKIGDVDCAPPLGLTRTWTFTSEFDREEVLKVAEDPRTEHIHPCLSGFSFVAPLDKAWNKPEFGARMLADFCRNSSTRADWGTICQVYRSPIAACWATPEAYYPGLRMLEDIADQWDKKFRDEILPLMKGYGAIFPVVLQRIWEADTCASKIMSSYLVRKLVMTFEVRYVAPGTLRI